MSVAGRDKPKTVFSRIRRVVIRWAVFYGIIVIVLAFLQRKLMYHPTVEPDVTPESAGVADHAQGVIARTKDGLELHGWHWQASQEPERPVVLFFHGNGGNRRHRVYDCRLFADCGADTVIFDYRGYAENPGKPSEEGLTLDARAAWDFVTQTLKVPRERIVLFGGSLGGGVAVRLAADLCREGTPPAGLMLRSTFSSMVDAASWHYPWLPVRWVLIDRYPSVDLAPQITCPVLQMHGDNDRIVPIESGRMLFEAFPQESAGGVKPIFVELPYTGHNGVLQTAWDEVAQETKQFLDRIFAAAD